MSKCYQKECKHNEKGVCTQKGICVNGEGRDANSKPAEALIVPRCFELDISKISV